MIRPQVGLYDSSDNLLLLASRPETLTMQTNEQGAMFVEWVEVLDDIEAQRVYNALPRPGWVLIHAGDTIWRGRVEDALLGDGFVRLIAMGSWVALRDVPYTALWSDTSVAGFYALSADDMAGSRSSIYEADNNNRLYITARVGETYAAGELLAWGYEVPHNGERDIVGVSFSFELVASSSWVARMRTHDSDWSGAAAQWTLTGNGATQTGAILVTFSGKPNISFDFRPTSPQSPYSGNTDDDYIKITSLRIVTASTNQVDTTLGTNILAGSRTVTPADMTGIYVGQALVISGTTSERVIVTAITTTTFTATFANGYSSSDTVKAFVIYGDEIASDLVSHVNGVNSDQLASSTALVQSPGLDLHDEVYLDAFPADILLYISRLGDSQATPRQWEVGVDVAKRLYLRPAGSDGRVWYVDATSLEIEQSLNEVVNSAYGVYRDPAGRLQRTSTDTNAQSVARFGVTRRGVVSTQSTSSTQVTTQASALLADRAFPKPRAGVVFSRVHTPAGAIAPNWAVRANQTLVIRNANPITTAVPDNVTSFKIGETFYDFLTNELTVSPAEPLPALDVLIARNAAGV